MLSTCRTHVESAAAGSPTSWLRPTGPLITSAASYPCQPPPASTSMPPSAVVRTRTAGLPPMLTPHIRAERSSASRAIWRWTRRAAGWWATSPSNRICGQRRAASTGCSTWAGRAAAVSCNVVAIVVAGPTSTASALLMNCRPVSRTSCCQDSRAAASRASRVGSGLSSRRYAASPSPASASGSIRYSTTRAELQVSCRATACARTPSPTTAMRLMPAPRLRLARRRRTAPH